MLGTVIVNHPVLPMYCSALPTTKSLPISLEGSPFTISAHYNSLVVLGCKNSVWLRANETTTTGGCTPICDFNSTDTSCNGVNCCQITIPTRLQELQYTYQSTQAGNNISCGYVIPVDKKWLSKDYKGYTTLLRNLSNPFDREFGIAPLVLEWEFEIADPYGGTSRDNSHIFYGYPYDFLCRSSSSYSYPHNLYSLSDYYSSDYYDPDDYVSSMIYCLCYDGFEGNPYLPGGCSDIDECALMINATLTSHYYCTPEDCVNTYGSYDCPDSRTRITHNIKIAFISIGSALGGLLLFVGGWKSTVRKLNDKRIPKCFLYSPYHLTN